ncbi:hypothetical protein QE152_g7083 [Popillia japonica]|uniref:Uncharacterized protein n=1 Tax=Popillia japonica TaxID=7064 RepID=A0AAW1MG12_POPJA
MGANITNHQNISGSSGSKYYKSPEYQRKQHIKFLAAKNTSRKPTSGTVWMRDLQSRQKARWLGLLNRMGARLAITPKGKMAGSLKPNGKRRARRRRIEWTKRVLQESASSRKRRRRARRRRIEAVMKDLVKVRAKDWRQKSKIC